MTIQSDAFTVAPYWSDLCLTDVSPASMIRVGTAVFGTNQFCLVQYDGICSDGEEARQDETNSLSWQLAVPFGDADRMYVRYSNQIGETDGQDASIGYQDFDGSSKCSYCYCERGKVSDGMSLMFAVGVGTSPILADSDGNGTNDFAVYRTQIAPVTHDADSDGLIDFVERQLGTNLLNTDSDGDGMSDGWEHQYGFNPLQNADADGDADNDGVSNLVESQQDSNPNSSDTDGDGLSDGDEITEGTSLTSSDTDGDGLSDKYEVDSGTEPTEPDTDRDGMTDGWEVANSLDPNDAEGDEGASGDPDDDGLTNVDEYQNNCDPLDDDTDGDGVNDGIEMFKRLWQSGSQNMFTAVTWYGNDSQSILYLNNTPDYYSNVDHALSTASAFAQSVAALPGTARYVAAHSLGNMMVSSAIADYGLSVSRYFMLNAAVPMEAYNTTVVTDSMRNNMTPSDWGSYALRLRANHWYELFDNNDARRDLTWKGRFASVNNAINYYSLDEDVLDNADGTVKDLLSEKFAWANQETRKGVWPALLPGNNEAGWSFNSGYDIDNPDYVGGGDPLTLHLPSAQAVTLADTQLKLNPFFGPFDDMSICTTNYIANIPIKNQLLADAIPAETYAAGRNPVQGLVNREMSAMKAGGGKWTHSFLVEAPYAWTYQMFIDIKGETE